MTTESLSYRSISFYGRTMAEYEQYFAFQADRYENKRILDCGAGCASFAAEARMRGVEAVAVDPLYSRNAAALETVARMDIDHVYEEASKAPEFFVFTHIRSFEEMRRRRMRAMERFIADYPSGLAMRRYVCASLPNLPFNDGHFDMSLCGHLLFLHSDRLDYALHLAACKELCRVTQGEVRIYPILGLDAQPYEHLDRLLEELENCRIAHEIRCVDYEFLRGADQILILKKLWQCHIDMKVSIYQADTLMEQNYREVEVARQAGICPWGCPGMRIERCASRNRRESSSFQQG